MKVLSPRRSCRLKWVSELLDEQGMWKTELVRHIFYPIDADVILGIKPARQFDDILAWQLEKSGIFSVKSAYRLAFNQSPIQCYFAATSARPEGDDECWQKIWKANVPPKVRMFAWKAASNALATEENKRARGIKVTGMCLICGSEKEDSRHALFSCGHARQLWAKMHGIWQLPSMSELDTCSGTWLRTVITVAQPRMVEAIMLVAWRVWFAHNEATHAKPLPHVDGSMRFLVSYLNLFRQTRQLSTEEILKGKQAAGPVNVHLGSIRTFPRRTSSLESIPLTLRIVGERQ
jgi:hypothetical protein